LITTFELIVLVNTYRGAILPKVSFQQNSAILGTFGDIGTFGNMRADFFFLFKDEKRVGVRNDVLIFKVFEFYKEFNIRFKCSKVPKCVELGTSPNAI
jgi:hypothetical protein